MKKKQCSSPRCGKVFVESDEAFSKGVCYICGMELLEVASTPSPPPAPEGRPAATNRSRKAPLAKPGAPFGDARPRVGKPAAKSTPEQPASEPPPKDVSKLSTKPSALSASISRKPPTIGGARLVVVDRHGQERLVFPLLHDQVSVGRRSTRNLSPDLDLADIDDTHAVGREHLVVFRLSGEWHVRALGSRSATFVNETILAAEQTQQLRNGDQIVLGADQGVGLLFENPT